MNNRKDTVDSVERAVRDIFGDVSAQILDHYYDNMRDEWQHEHKRKLSIVNTKLGHFFNYMFREDNITPIGNYNKRLKKFNSLLGHYGVKNKNRQVFFEIYLRNHMA